MNKRGNINSDFLFNSVLLLTHYKYFQDTMIMEKEAERLLREISLMNNIHGFTARHYVKESSATGFIISLHREIVKGFQINDQELKDEITDFVKRHNELTNKIEKQ